MPLTRRQRVVALIHRVLPWCSLAVGILGALFMDRGPARGAIVAAVAVASWLIFFVVLWLGRLRDRAGTASAGRIIDGAHFSTLMLTQSSIHLQLYFALPFYFKAYAGTPGHVVFLAMLVLAALASLWDPWTERLLLHTRIGLLLPAFANFAVLDAVLPGLGLSNRASLWLAAGVAGIGLPVMVVADRLHGRPLVRALLTAVAIALVIPAALLLGGARIVPAAPMHLVHAEIGTRRSGYDVADPAERLAHAPARLVCATSIFAPLGVKDHLFHVWRHEGVVTDRILLDISGGRDGGFRTYSIKRNFGDAPAGRWSCAVETEMGQLLGERELEIDS
ncbi:MAG: DUF2914 domain-containing protein [Deltaproteobacteria bacterium]|nr:DUF2914 domain-containing protein [Nannocystaceae bacterium]